MKRADLAFAAALVPLDYLALVAAGAVAYSVRFIPFFTSIKPVIFTLTFDGFLRVAALVAFVYLGVFALAGLYAIRPRRLADEMTRIFFASSTGIAAVLAIAFFSRAFFDSRFIVLAAWGCSVVFVCIERLLVRGLQRSLRHVGIGLQRVAIFGNTKNAGDIERFFTRFPRFGFRVVVHEAHVTKDTLYRLRDLRRRDKIDAVLLANPDAGHDEIRDLKSFADTEHVNFFYSADPFTETTVRPIVHTFAGQPVIEVPKTPLDGWGAIYKRLFDIVFSLALILLTLPLQMLIALALFVEQPGSVLFRKLPDGRPAARVGQGGKPFSFLKFRSMIKNAHAYRFDPEFIKEHGNLREGTPLFKLKNDPRVTQVGKFLRALSLDEIPQFYLVLFGSMSLVGPRPHLPEEVAAYKPEYRRVLAIKPGITGISQVSGRAGLDFDDEIRLDMTYIENWNPWLDFVILLKTPFAVLFRRGAY